MQNVINMKECHEPHPDLIHDSLAIFAYNLKSLVKQIAPDGKIRMNDVDNLTKKFREELVKYSDLDIDFNQTS